MAADDEFADVEPAERDAGLFLIGALNSVFLPSNSSVRAKLSVAAELKGPDDAFVHRTRHRDGTPVEFHVDAEFAKAAARELIRVAAELAADEGWPKHRDFLRAYFEPHPGMDEAREAREAADRMTDLLREIAELDTDDRRRAYELGEAMIRTAWVMIGGMSAIQTARGR